MTHLEIENLSKSYSGVPVLRRVSCIFERGQVYGLVGPNGSGKTTLLNIISGFAGSDSGSVYFETRKLDRLTPEQRWTLGFARSFQDNRLALRLTVAQNIGLAVRGQTGEGALGAILRWREISPSNERVRKRVVALLDNVGLADLIDQVCGTLSFGQQKLVSVLSCLASEPKFLFLDEPAAGLSPVLKQRVLELILSYIEQSGAGAVVVDHDLDFMQRISSRVFFMNLGTVVATGTVQELRQNPLVIAAYLGGAIPPVGST
jgi:ABC-type branched-subunit amino acid transport system ATPase component